MMRATGVRAALAALALAAPITLAACGGDGGGATTGAATTVAADAPVIVATTPVLGAIVRDAVGSRAQVRVIMPNGSDPHEWRPSARDVAALESADLVVENGLGLEQGLEESIDRVREGGTPVFTATDHVDVRMVEDEPHSDGADHDHDHEEGHDHGAGDPHFWTDPQQVRSVVAALPGAVRTATGTDVSASAREARTRLAALDSRAQAAFAAVPASARHLVTGHESLGYLADRYGLEVVGAVTPSLSSEGQVSAAHLKELEDAMREAGVRVVFTESGLPDAVTDAIVAETGATVVEVGTEAMPEDGAYSTYIRELTGRISSALSNSGG
jgi:zinc/manganese transport system substrate-binding protein